MDQSRAPGAAGEARGHRTDLAALRYEWQAVHGELSSVIEAILAQIFATASRQAVEALARLEREGADILGDLEARRATAEAEMTELAARVEHLERRVGMAEEERRQALEAAERATSELLARARRQADEIVGEAESRAAARHGEAEEAAAQRIADAEARATEILEQAQRRVEEIEREAAEAERASPVQATGVAEAAVVEDQLRGLADRINRLLQTTSEVAATAAPDQQAGGEATPPERGLALDVAGPRFEPPAAGGPPSDEDQAEADGGEILAAGSSDATPAGRPDDGSRPAEPVALAPGAAEAAADRDAAPGDGAGDQTPAREVIVPLRPRTTGNPDAPTGGENLVGATFMEPGRPERDASVADEPAPWLAPAAALDREREGRPATLPAEDTGHEREGPVTDEDARWRDIAPPRPNGVAEPPRRLQLPRSPDAGPGEGEDPATPPVETLIFQAVPNFQAALALERALKALPGVRDVRVADFDERQLTFQVTHELGSGLPREVLALRSHELELVESGPERAEFVFRA